jgi:hypothetical protein
MSDNNLLDTAGAASWLQQHYHFGSVSTLTKQRHYGTGPSFLLFGKRPRYRVSDLKTWAEARLSDRSYSHTAEYVPQDRAA